MIKHAKLRICASCEWIFKLTQKDNMCPQCGFAHYGARSVYGNKVYRYAKTQEPWLRKKLFKYKIELLKIINTNNNKKGAINDNIATNN